MISTDDWHALDQSRTNVDSVLDYYATIPTGSRDESPMRHVNEPLHPYVANDIVRAQQEVLSFEENWDNDSQDELDMTHPGRHRHQRKFVDHSAARQGSNDMNGGDEKQYSGFSRIPQPRDRCANHANAGEATRLSYTSHPQSALPRRQSPALDAASQIPRSPSLPLDILSESRMQPVRHHAVDKFASLPLRQKNASSTHPRRTVSVSHSGRYNDTPTTKKDARQLREEQARRIQAINQAPSGRPPWLDVFQPDPRLPPDQQLLPTIARKQAMDQWISEGHTKETFSSSWSHAPKEEEDEEADVSADPSLLNVSSSEYDDGSGGGAGTSKTSGSHETVIHKPVLGQDPTSALSRHTSSRSLSLPNFSRRNTLSTSAPQLPIPAITADVDMSAKQQDARMQESPPAQYTPQTPPPVQPMIQNTPQAPLKVPESRSAHGEKQPLEKAKSAFCCVVM